MSKQYTNEDAEAELKQIIETLYLSNHYEQLLKRSSIDRREKDEIYHDIRVIQDYGILSEERWSRVRIWSLIADFQHATTVSYILHTMIFHDMDYLPLVHGQVQILKNPRNYYYQQARREEKLRNDSRNRKKSLDEAVEKPGGNMAPDSEETRKYDLHDRESE